VTDAAPAFNAAILAGMRARWRGEPAHADNYGASDDVKAGWAMMDERLTRPAPPADGVEGAFYQAAAEDLLAHLMEHGWTKAAKPLFRLLQIADMRVAKCRGQVENDTTFLEELTALSKLGISLPDLSG
jgi:hypothetical protein